jgi:hypothetical protein
VFGDGGGHRSVNSGRICDITADFGALDIPADHLVSGCRKKFGDSLSDSRTRTRNQRDGH